MDNLVAVKIGNDPELLIVGRDAGSDLPVISQIWASRVYDLQGLRRWDDLHETMMDMESRGKRPLVIDAGANIGASALFFATLIKGSHVIAVEPERNNFAILSHNAQQMANVDCVHGAISSQRGQFSVFDPQKGDVGFRAARSDDPRDGDDVWTGDVVDAFSVSDLIRLAPDDCEPFMIKIDIEGGERDLFAKNTSWIDLFPLIVVELHDWMLPGTANSRNFLCAIAATGRDFVQVGENIFSIRN